MGAVYLAEHTMLGRSAAIKVLLPALSQNRDVVGRFFNEARAATAIRHPGIVEIYDFGFLADGAAYIAMEMLDGETLTSRLHRAGRLALGAALEISRQIAAALHAAHGRGITHRDLKPDNIFLVKDPEIGERVKLLDFGIAKLVTEDRGNRTRTGVVMGTPTYMSPEQCRGATELDSRADLYSLGCVLYELLTSRPPFVAESAGDIIAHHLYFQPDPVRTHEASVPEPVERLIMALLAKDPGMRPSSAADVAAMLDGWRTLRVAPHHVVAPAMPATVVLPSSVLPSSVPTTLSGAAGVVASAAMSGVIRPRRRMGLIAAGAGAVMTAAVAIVVLTMPGQPPPTSVAAQSPGESPTAPTPSAPPAAAPTPSPPPAAASDAVAPNPAATEPVAPPAAAAPASPGETTIDRPASPAQAAAEMTARPERTSEPIEVPAPARPAQRASVPPKVPGSSTKAPREVAPVEPSHEERKRPTRNADAPVATPPRIDAKASAPSTNATARPAEPEAKPKIEPTTAGSGAGAKPAGSKWGRLMGDRTTADIDDFDLARCKAAAESGNCTLAKSVAARIAERNVAMYRTRVLTNAAIAACLNAK